MDLSRQEYPSLLTTLQPEQAVQVLNRRVALINLVNSSIADFLQERRRIEERYAAELRKLSKRPQPSGPAALGVFQLPWQRIIAGTESLAQSHETLASKIETDVELPLKQYNVNNREMQAMSTVQGNLAAIATEMIKARERAGKLNAKGGREAENAGSLVDDASREWESQAPFVFEQLQALDENRVNHLRDVLTQFQTHEADQVERNRTSAEACLNALLNIETADEIKTFAAQVQQDGAAGVSRQSTIGPERRMSSSGNIPPVPPPPRNQDQRLRSVPSADRLNPLPEITPQKSKMGGLKRLGTVMSRRKNAAPPPPQTLSEKKREKSRSFAPFRRGDSSRSFGALEATGRDLTPITSLTGRPRSQQASTELDRPVTVDGSREAVNGMESHVQQDSTTNAPRELQPPLIPAQAHPPERTIHEMSSHAPIQQGVSQPSTDDVFAPATNSTPQAGYELEDSSRHLKIRDQPIQEDTFAAELAMTNMAEQLRLQAPNNVKRTQGSLRGRRDVRNTMFIPGNQEIPGLGASSSGLLPQIAGSPPATSGPTPPLPTTDVLTDLRRSTGPSIAADDHPTGSDVNSIHSATSLAGVVQHPELHEQGLNASIVETVTTIFSETDVTKSSVIGEIAFAHVASSHPASSEHETVRLQNFQVLEKIAVNPVFMTASKDSSSINAEDQAGSYSVALASIRRSTPTVGLKYQLHLDDTNLAQYSPLLIKPAWQIIDGQASAIVEYGLNPAYTPSTSISINTLQPDLVLHNVTISVNLDVKTSTGSVPVGRPTSAMMAPIQGASFKRKAGTVLWRFPELKIKAQRERLLVRFITEGGLAKKSGIEVKFEMPDATASRLGVERFVSSGSAPAAEVDPFADEEERRSAEHTAAGASGGSSWAVVPTKKLLVSGRYAAV